MLNAEKMSQIAEQAPALALEYLHKGEMIDFSDDIKKNQTTIKEMIGTDDGGAAFLQKINYDLVEGEAQVALLYKGIYETVTDASLPEVFIDESMGDFQVVFLKKLEGGEVTFGAMGPGERKVVQIFTWAAGLEYSEDMVEYNKLFQISRAGKAFGRSYNKLLNHLHLGPIITGTYTTTGGGLAAQKTAQEGNGTANSGVAQLIAYNTSIEQTLLDAVQVFPNGYFMLVNSFDVPALQGAIAASMLPDMSESVVKAKLRTENFIVYDAVTIKVGKRTYTYDGVAQGFMYLVSNAKANFTEYIKHDLRTDAGDGNLSRLIVSQIVGRARRGVMAAIGGAQGAVKVDIAA